MDKSLIVEFYGIAGVGKTTLCNELYKNLKTKNIKCTNINNKNIPFRYKFNIKIFVRSLFLVLKTKPKFPNKLLNNLRQLYTNQLRIIYYNKFSGIHLSDQGVFQTVGTMQKHSRSLASMDIWDEKLTKNIFLPDILIILTSHTDTIVQQRYERDGIIIDATEMKRRQKRVQKTIEDANYIYNQKPNLFKYLIVCNKGLKTKDILVDEIVNFVLDN